MVVARSLARLLGHSRTRSIIEKKAKRYTILDAPGHKSFVPNMISGASQADIGVLVISARKGEFETGFERGGQTREHAQLAKTLGVSKLVVAVNKMDDPSIVEAGDTWSKARYDEIVSKLTPFLKGCGYKPSDLVYVPISGLMGKNMREKIGGEVCGWYEGKPLFEILDGIEPGSRDPYAAFRMPVMDKYKDMGTIVMGKCESGVAEKGMRLVMMPNKVGGIIIIDGWGRFTPPSRSSLTLPPSDSLTRATRFSRSPRCPSRWRPCGGTRWRSRPPSRERT